MIFFEKLGYHVFSKKTFLCVGLDPVIDKMPQHLPRTHQGLLEFLLNIVEQTKDYAAAYKPNFAYFEALGISGLDILRELIKEITPEVSIIGDAKRCDVGHSAQMYAKAVFENLECDAVTLSPYLGQDSLKPFFEYTDRGVFILCLTSNQGANDFQLPDLYLNVAKKAQEWNVSGNVGLVVGATFPKKIKAIRKITGQMPFLIPGVGTQGGDLEKTLVYANNESNLPYLINASRSIIYASSKEDYAQQAGIAAKQLRDRINSHRSNL
ncbi:MAG: orotidine-5'-phosphate decarboxylase [Deltaproteobacteria bacterium]|nr:orotidine-5'-phosphate decarboxylase [Deltaproteobacteria bacterium]|tara:strand:+ start:512 stop:1312 length:801 start_codon:yes stop_codon:yes gene_type:complete